MTDTTTLGFPEAARRLGVPVRVLRAAIRSGKLPAPAKVSATASLSADWFASAQAAASALPHGIGRARPQAVPPFARYEGTSCWRKYRNRVRAFYRHQAAAN